MPTQRKRKKSKVIKLSGLTTLILVVGCMIFVFMETHSLLAVGLAAVLVVAGSIISLIGFIPFGIGPAIYYFVLWPWLLQNTVLHYPMIQMPVTLFIISTYTVILSIVWTFFASIIILAFRH
jgi:hypothetical protein